jgi:hypothetical protein
LGCGFQVGLTFFAAVLLRQPTDFHWGAIIIMALTIITLPFQMGVLNSAFTKVVPLSVVSRMMAVITAVGTLGRVVGPLWGGDAPYEDGIVWIGNFVVAAIGAVAFVWDFRKMVPQAAPADKVDTGVQKGTVEACSREASLDQLLRR